MGNTNTKTARYSDLERENPNIRSQHEEWQRQRSERGEDANDYKAFRSHLKDIGSPDPGEQEFEEFRSDRSGSMNVDQSRVGDSRAGERETVGAGARSSS